MSRLFIKLYSYVMKSNNLKVTCSNIHKIYFSLTVENWQWDRFSFE
jgi:hypothetical protein